MKYDIDNLRVKPWLQLPEEDVLDVTIPKGFIGEEERRSYHYIARHCLSGNGSIVDAGAFIGSSAYCFASGLSKNENRGYTLIHSYDRFAVGEDYVAELISKNFRPSKGGDDFFDIFEYQTGKYKDLIRSHKGDFMDMTWEGGRIDILFVDLAKTNDLHTRIVEQFYTHLIPSESLLMHQDFYHPWNPWVHQGMQYLSKKFALLDEYIPSNSRLFLSVAQVTSNDVEAIRNLSPEHRIALMDEFIDGEKGDQRAMARVSKLCQLWFDKDVNGYADERARIVSEFGWQQNTAWGSLGSQLDQLIKQVT